MITLPALSIRQPWPWAMIHAGKDIENRDWRTHFRGRFLIHAAQGMTRREYERFVEFCHDISGEVPFPSGLTIPAYEDLERGGIVGVAEIVDCVDFSDSAWFFGLYGYVLRNVRPLPFHPCKGRLGFFKVHYPFEVAA